MRNNVTLHRVALAKALIFLTAFLLLAQDVYSFSPRGRESREQRQENTNRLRDMLSYLYRTTAVAAAVKGSSEPKSTPWPRLESQLAQASAIWPKIAHRLTPARAATIGVRFEQAALVLEERGDLAVLVANLDELLAVLLESFMVVSTPAQTPEFELGRRVFRTTCVSCHGADGHGDGILAANLNPPPTSFFHPDYHQSLSPFAVFNVVLRGVEGQAKNSFEHLLTAHEMWSVAFYVKALPHLDSTQAAADNQSWFAKKGGSLQLLASLNDRQLLVWLNDQTAPSEPDTNQSYLSYLRTRGVYSGSLIRN